MCIFYWQVTLCKLTVNLSLVVCRYLESIQTDVKARAISDGWTLYAITSKTLHFVTLNFTLRHPEQSEGSRSFRVHQEILRFAQDDKI